MTVTTDPRPQQLDDLVAGLQNGAWGPQGAQR